MGFTVYIIECGDGSLYVGHTHDLDQRLEYHQNGKGSVHLAQRGFGRLLYAEVVPNKMLAVQRERQLKGWSRAKKLALAVGDFNRLKAMSRSHDERSVAEVPRGVC